MARLAPSFTLRLAVIVSILLVLVIGGLLLLRAMLSQGGCWACGF